MTRTTFGWAAGLALLAGLSACSSFSSSDAPRTDAGSEGGDVTGTPSGVLSIREIADGPVLLVHGSTTRVRVMIERSGGLTASIRVQLNGAPEGISAIPIELAPGITEGDLEVQVAPEVPQGSVPEMTVAATNSAVGVATGVRFSAFVRGRAGEIDTTYGDGGIVDLPYGRFTLGAGSNAGEAISAPPPGAPAPAKSVKVDAAGTLVSGFSADIRYGDATSYFNGFIYACSVLNTQPTMRVEVQRYSFATGARDESFALSTTVTANGVYEYVSKCLVFPDGNVAAAVSYQAYGVNQGFVSWLRTDRTSAISVLTSSHLPIDAAVSSGALITLEMVDGNPDAFTVHRYLESNGSADASFCFNQGYARLALRDYRSVAVDGKGQIYVGYNRGVIRLDERGLGDQSFLGGGEASMGGASVLAIQPDGRLLNATNNDQRNATVVTRYGAATGALERAFGESGYLSMPVTGSLDRIGFLPDGRIFGSITTGGASGSRVVRLWN